MVNEARSRCTNYNGEVMARSFENGHSSSTNFSPMQQNNHLGEEERDGWLIKKVRLTRVSGYGFGIAVSGGADNPHFQNGDPAIAISDVIKGGPAQNILMTNDRILSANNHPLDNLPYASAVQILRDSGPTVELVIKRRVNPVRTVELVRDNGEKKVSNLERDFGIVLGTRVYVKEMRGPPIAGINVGDIITHLNGTCIDDFSSLKEVKRLVENASTRRLLLSVYKGLSLAFNNESEDQLTNGHEVETPGNLYVQPPTLKGNHSRQNSAASMGSANRAHIPLPQPPLPATPDSRRETPGSMTPARRSVTPNNTLNLTNGQVTTISIPKPQKSTPLGIRLLGGNKTGIFIAAVQQNTPAWSSGITPGHQIIQVNFEEFSGKTREEAVTYLQKVPPGNITLKVKYDEATFRKIQAQPYHDSFHVRTNFEFPGIFKAGQILQVIDSFVEGGGKWRLEGGEIVPSYEAGVNLMGGGVSKRRNGLSRIYDTVIGAKAQKEGEEDPVPYERVEWREIKSRRPVVLFGPVAKFMQSKLASEFPRLFTVLEPASGSSGSYKTDSLKSPSNNIHILMDLHPKTIKTLKSSGIYPLSIYIDLESRRVLKESQNGVTSTNSLKRSKSFLSAAQINGNGNSNVFSTQRSRLDTWNKFRDKYKDQFDSVVVISSLKDSQSVKDSVLRTQGIGFWDAVKTPEDLPPPPPYIPIFKCHAQCLDPISPSKPEQELPNYNLPPTFACMDSIYDYSTKSYDHTTPVQSPQAVGNPQTPMRGLLAHSPEPPPKVDRSKKPEAMMMPTPKNEPSFRPYKPLPPPKPSKAFINSKRNQNQHREFVDDKDSYYLNLPSRQTERTETRLNYNTDYVTEGVIGPEGGILSQAVYPSGHVQLIVPKGALKYNTTLWFQVIKQVDLNELKMEGSQTQTLSPLVKFGPEGICFQKGVEIRIPQFSAPSAEVESSVHTGLKRQRSSASVLLSNQNSWTQVPISNDENSDNPQQSNGFNMVALTVHHF